MKKLLFLLPALLFFNLVPAFAQETSIVDNVMKDFDLQQLGIRLFINFAAIFVLVHLIYYRRHQNKDFQFTLILFNCVNFLLCYLLSGANLEVGFAFGLFAIFSIMRYRTVTVPIKEMGYLFISVALGLINSLATTQDNYIVLISANAFIILLPMFMDRGINITPTKAAKDKGSKKEATTTQANTSSELTQDIIYERIDLIKPRMRKEMLEDLRNRTGLPVYKVDVISIDLMQDVAVIKAHYSNQETEHLIDMIPNYSKENVSPIAVTTNHV